MPIKLNNVIIHGKIEHKRAPQIWKSRKLNFYNNHLVLNQKSLNISLCRHIRYLLCEKDITQLVRKLVKKEFKGKINQLNLEITNVHHSITLGYSNETITPLLQKLHERFFIESAEVTQELNVPGPVSIRQLLSPGEKTGYLSVRLSFFKDTTTKKPRASVKIQLTKKKTACATIIVSSWTKQCKDLVNFFENV